MQRPFLSPRSLTLQTQDPAPSHLSFPPSSLSPQIQPQKRFGSARCSFGPWLSSCTYHSTAAEKGKKIGAKEEKDDIITQFQQFSRSWMCRFGCQLSSPGLEKVILSCCLVACTLQLSSWILLRQCQQHPGVSLVSSCFVTCQEAAKIHLLQGIPMPRPNRQELLELC